LPRETKTFFHHTTSTQRIKIFSHITPIAFNLLIALIKASGHYLQTLNPSTALFA
jgi:hypothetical protein